jgi:dTDP-4-dehydrorhamnose 3,5-epimerase
MPFNCKRSTKPDVIVIEPVGFEDRRGAFFEIYKQSDFCAFGIEQAFVQDNYSHSVYGVLRGLHYQKLPKAQGKLIVVLRGRIFDVAVDIRKGSRTFGAWVGEELSAKELRMLYIPPGFAHGFCVLSDEADVVYKVTSEYAPELDRGIIWNDPAIGIEWPVADPIVSDKDSQLPRLAKADNNFSMGGSRNKQKGTGIHG